MEEFTKIPFISSKWWTYTINLLDECPLDGTIDAYTFGEECSTRVMKKYGIDVERVETCMAQTKEMIPVRSDFHSGAVDEHSVVSKSFEDQWMEIQRDLRRRPGDPRDLCGLRGTSCLPRVQMRPGGPPGVSFSQMVEAIVATALLGICVMYFYKRSLTRHVHTALREEVMLEVQSEMARCATSVGDQRPQRHFPCQFSCHTADECAKSNVDLAYADDNFLLCGKCSVTACALCDTESTCTRCHSGFHVNQDEACIWAAVGSFKAIQIRGLVAAV
eukprot:g33144.t1